MSASGNTFQRYRDTLESLLEGFQIIAHDWTYLYVNPAAAQHGRRLVDELTGRKIWEVYPGTEHTALFATLKSCMLERKAASLETLFTFPDGATRWFEIRVEPVPEGICIHSVDIQSRKEAETLLREQENVASLGRMAAVVAHELKNPLAGLSGALQVLKEQRSPVDRDVPLFDEMLKSIQSLDRLIRDLLVFAKPLQIEPQPISMEEIVRSALSYFDGDRALKPHSVHLSVEHPPPIVSADQELLKNVFRNLLLNAAQAMQEAGSIDVCVSRHESTCRVTVADNGPGIPPELASRIFQPFVTGRKGGTGLGLAISRRLLRLHGGDLELLTTPSPGAAFRATVPLHGAT